MALNFEKGNFLLTSNYSDFLLGTNWQTVYYGYIMNNAAEATVLWRNTFNSVNDSTEISNLQTDFTKEIDINFDNNMQAERIVGGAGKIEGKWSLTNDGALPVVEGYVIAKLIKYHLGVQTVTETRTTSGTSEFSFNLIMDITRIHFSSKDTLRLTLELWLKSTHAGAGKKGKLYHDGTDKFEIPFAKLDEY